jgi:hypothetical protein
MLPSVNTPASIAAHKGPIVYVSLEVGLLDALLREDHGASIFVLLARVDGGHGILLGARLVFLYGWLCVEIDRYRAESAL